jgi:hypothetical protein
MPQISPASPDNESIKKTAAAAEKLTEATIQFNIETSKQTTHIIFLTQLMLIGLIIQILMAAHVSRTCLEDDNNKQRCTTKFDLGLMGQYESNLNIGD